jgi:hypothetical protein
MSVYPIPFWVVIAILLGGAVWSIQRVKDGTGIPMLAVLGTVAAWYVGDAFYNDYEHSYVKIFDEDVLENAWWEVVVFLVVFLIAVPGMHRWFNARYLQQQSGVYQLMRFGTNQPFLQWQLDIFFRACLVAYLIIVAIATLRLGSQIPYFFFPFLGYKAEPWGRNRIGSGFDAALSLAEYIQLMVSAVFGVIAAVSHNRRTRILSLILCFLSWPYFLFDRTRNAILTVVVPALLSWAFLRLRGGIWKKVLVLAGCYILLDGWMAFIIQNRSDESIATAFHDRGFNLEQESNVHHEGLNMFEELSWINTFIKKGTYDPNWGARYFAELVNPIPRVLWHNKPLIGIDYAIARGQGSGAGKGNDQANVYATVSTGLIGQGVVNFGGILGPAAAALLMSFWVAVMARQDLNIWKLGRLPLYALGLILTFNLGRDITFITLYPFVFLAAGLWWVDRHPPAWLGTAMRAQPAPVPVPAAGQLAQQGGNRPVRRSFRKPRQFPVRPRRMMPRVRAPRRRMSSGGQSGIPPQS